MLTFVVKRVMQAFVVIFLVIIVVFLLLHTVRGGPARGILGPHASREAIAAFNHAQGFDRSLPAQFGLYLDRLVRLDLGQSYQLNQSVGALLVERVPKTLALNGLSLAGAVLVAVPLGVWQGRGRRGAADHVITGMVFVGYATPVFFLGLLLIIGLSEAVPLFPATAPQSDSLFSILSDWRGLVLPVLTGAIVTIAAFSRYIRSAVLENLAQDYVRTARAKGAAERRVVWLHVLRNSLTPVIAMLGFYLPVLFSGSLVIESMFNYPGLGLLFWNAAQTSDYPVLLGVVLVIAVATVLGSLVADLVQAIVDPRVRGALS